MPDQSTFWHLAPPADDDYLHARLHGTVEYTHWLPVTGCRECAAVLGVVGRTLPAECPAAWRAAYDARPRRGHQHYRTNAEFVALRAALERDLPPEVAPLRPLRPGDQFAPARWRVPSWPVDDVLWPEIGAALVSDRLRAALEQAGVSGVYFAPVAVERVGRKPARRMAPARGGEPEDAWRRIPPPSGEVTPPTYWHMGVSAQSGTGDLPVCPGCGRVARGAPDARHWLGDPAWLRATWSGADVFRPLGAGYILVTERVRGVFAGLGATGAEFRDPGTLAAAASA
jgi:hypothetical protein